MPTLQDHDEPGLRERKKLAVRDALVDAALELFDRDGVDATTVEQISAHVGVSSRTFHRYFPTKLEVMFADRAERSARFERALAERPADEPLLVSLRESLCVLTDMLATRRDVELRRSRLIEAHPGLRASNLERSEAWAASVGVLSAARLGVRADDLLPKVLGASAVGALRAARARWLAGTVPDLTAEFRRAFQMVIALGDVVDGRVR